ncbi:MAG: hypothetical protein COA79_13300 [Planctomycetota bacterium]|nr:MAG: hypothetical protein COA79_13300 [Planctomycetota bacterium]
MGIVNFGVPEKEVSFLKNLMNLSIFVEGGTFKGGTAKLMSQDFNKVYTIEKSEKMYLVAKENLTTLTNVVLLKGDTRDHLKDILEENDNLLFWLDAHWCGYESYGDSDECPLIEELKNIFSYEKNYVILIDDARLFLSPPPQPHRISQWPDLKEIMEALPNNWGIIEYEDVIYLYPNKIRDDIKNFLQIEVTKKNQQENKEINKANSTSFLHKIYNKIRPRE